MSYFASNNMCKLFKVVLELEGEWLPKVQRIYNIELKSTSTQAELSIRFCFLLDHSAFCVSFFFLHTVWMNHCTK